MTSHYLMKLSVTSVVRVLYAKENLHKIIVVLLFFCDRNEKFSTADVEGKCRGKWRKRRKRISRKVKSYMAFWHEERKSV